MHLQRAEHWEQKALQARDAAEKLSAEGAKATMLEMAEHYEKLARHARVIAAMLNESPENSPN